jgi:BON domain
MKEIEMSGHKPIYTLALASILAGVLTGCADLRSSGAQSAIPTAQIKADAESRLDQMTDLGPPGSIRVQTLANVVYLNGVVDGGLAKRNAEAVVRDVPGVQNVVNDIDVAHK